MKRTNGIIWLFMVATLVSAAILMGAVFLDYAEDIHDSLKKFNYILSVVEERYPEELNAEKAIYSAIRGMLRNLDPHSNFLDEKEFQDISEEHEGKFYGLGIQIAKRGEDKPLTVIAPIDNTPAKRAGLRAGDIISHIEGQETMGMSVQEAVKKLKGPKGTSVTITIKRIGIDEPLQFTIVRDEIPLESVTSAFIIKPGIGYIRITNFNQYTYRDFDAAFSNLESEGMERLILDLRDNAGGLLDQGVLVASRFIGTGKMVVFTKGRIISSSQEFYSEGGVPHETIPLIILVDRGTASAAEIVSGAVQDHDRGLIVGETTFGKGLVQKSYSLNGNTGLLLTTARYYTPSGRLIQRDYSSLEDYFLSEDLGYEERPDQTGREIRHTDSGRTVHGGGGITPDI
ncbi:MAG: S41 family peptidase, partial [Acidobacteriota bacterium]